MRSITAPELARWLAAAEGQPPVVLDVREPWELAIAKLPDAVAMPMGSVMASFTRLDPDRPTVCLCHHGVRSLQVALFLEHQGFSDPINLSGGIQAWAEEVDPAVAMY